MLSYEILHIYFKDSFLDDKITHVFTISRTYLLCLCGYPNISLSVLIINQLLKTLEKARIRRRGKVVDGYYARTVNNNAFIHVSSVKKPRSHTRNKCLSCVCNNHNQQVCAALKIIAVSISARKESETTKTTTVDQNVRIELSPHIKNNVLW